MRILITIIILSLAVLLTGCFVNQKSEFIKIAINEAIKKGYDLDSSLIVCKYKNELLLAPSLVNTYRSYLKDSFDTKDFAVVTVQQGCLPRFGRFICFVEIKTGKILFSEKEK